MTSVRTFLRRQGLALLALVIALTGGVAYAADTIFSEDIVDGEVKSVDIGNNQVKNPDLADGSVSRDEIEDDSIISEDVHNDTLTADDLAEFKLVKQVGLIANDTVGGPATNVLLVDNAASGFQIIGRCDQATAGAVKAQILYKHVGPTARTSAVDSTAPGGVNDAGAVAHNSEATLLSLGPTTGVHVADGTFTVFIGGGPLVVNQLVGTVSATTNFNSVNCRWETTVLG
jgi:hypothetical protein